MCMYIFYLKKVVLGFMDIVFFFIFALDLAEIDFCFLSTGHDKS